MPALGEHQCLHVFPKTCCPFRCGVPLLDWAFARPDDGAALAQREGVRFGLLQHGRCLIADEMGLGKTVQAIALACHYRREWPMLVVVPASMRLVWADELEKWVPGLQPGDINVVYKMSDTDRLATAPVTVVTYHAFSSQTAVSTVLAQLVRLARARALPCPPCTQSHAASVHPPQLPRVIVLDESHSIKSLKAARTMRLMPILQRARRLILLSGTPALSRPADLYPQARALLLVARCPPPVACAYAGSALHGWPHG